MNKKHWTMILLGVGAISLMSFASAKATQASEIFKNILIKIEDITNFHWIGIKKIKFDVTIRLQNPTPQDFSASSGKMIKGKGWILFKKGTQIASGQLHSLSEINLPAYGEYVFEPFTVEIGVKEFFSEAIKTVTGDDSFFGSIEKAIKGDWKIKELDWKKQLDDFTYLVDIEGMGNIYSFRGKLV